MNPLELTSQPLELREANLAPESRNRVLVRKPVMLRGVDGRIIGTQHRTQDQIVEDFWRRVKKGQENECWEWQAGKNGPPPKNYGIMWVNGKKWKTHVFAYTISFGLTNGLFVCHKCDNPPCCNPNHLFLGTCLDNTMDMISKGRKVSERGEDRYNSTLTEDDIREIRRRYKYHTYGPDSGSALAREFGVGPTMISAIIHRRRWKHVT